MVGPRDIPKGWRGCPVLIANSTEHRNCCGRSGRKLKCERDDWQQLPRPADVKVMQCVDKAMSEASSIADEGVDRKADAQIGSGTPALGGGVGRGGEEYGGADVGIIVYKAPESGSRSTVSCRSGSNWFTTATSPARRAGEGAGAVRDWAAAPVRLRSSSQTTEALFGDYIAEQGLPDQGERRQDPDPCNWRAGQRYGEAGLLRTLPGPPGRTGPAAWVTEAASIQAIGGAGGAAGAR